MCGTQAYQGFYTATGLRENALAPGQCWMLKEYLRHFSFSIKKHGL